MSRWVFLTLATGAALAGLASPLTAAPTEEQKAAIRASCRADFRAHCAGVPAGGAEALQCLETNLSQLSANCQAAVKAATE
jgi:hypothetical protein